MKWGMLPIWRHQTEQGDIDIRDATPSLKGGCVVRTGLSPTLVKCGCYTILSEHCDVRVPWHGTWPKIQPKCLTTIRVCLALEAIHYRRPMSYHLVDNFPLILSPLLSRLGRVDSVVLLHVARATVWQDMTLLISTIKTREARTQP